MYPIPTGKGVGVEQVPGDGNPVTFDVFELTISRRVGDAWEQVYLSRGNPGQLIITDKRVVTHSFRQGAEEPQHVRPERRRAGRRRHRKASR